MATRNTAQDAFNPEREFMDREEIEEQQDRTLREQTEYAYENTEHYRELFDEEGIDPSDVKTRRDFQRLVPTMLKEELRENRTEDDPYGGFLAIDPDEIDYIHTSTGTTGVPTYMPVTEEEVDAAAERTARLIYQSGIEPGEVAISPGLYYHLYTRIREYTLRKKLGATHFNRGAFPFELEKDLEEALPLWTMQDPVFIGGQLKKLTNICKNEGIDPQEAFPNLKAVMTAGQLVTVTARERLEEFWGVPVLEGAGPTDTMAGLAMLCEGRKQGWGHFFEDMGFYEILDLDTLEPVAEGERGEHTYTTFMMKSTPYLRWRSEDAGVHGGYDCSCGRCHLKSKILGRTSQMIRVADDGGEKRLFPRDFETVRDRNTEDVAPYQLVRRSEQPQDSFDVVFSGDVSDEKRAEIAADVEGDVEVPVTVDRIDVEDIPMKGGWKPQLIREED